MKVHTLGLLLFLSCCASPQEIPPSPMPELPAEVEIQETLYTCVIKLGEAPADELPCPLSKDQTIALTLGTDPLMATLKETSYGYELTGTLAGKVVVAEMWKQGEQNLSGLLRSNEKVIGSLSMHRD